MALYTEYIFLLITLIIIVRCVLSKFVCVGECQFYKVIPTDTVRKTRKTCFGCFLILVSLFFDNKSLLALKNWCGLDDKYLTGKWHVLYKSLMFASSDLLHKVFDVFPTRKKRTYHFDSKFIFIKHHR